MAINFSLKMIDWIATIDFLLIDIGRHQILKSVAL